MSDDNDDERDDWHGDWFEDHPLAHVIFDTETFEQLAVNRAATLRYGYARDELLRMSRLEMLVPEHRDALRRFVAGLPGSAANPPTWCELHRSGRVLRSDVRGQPVRFRDRPARLIVVMDAEPRTRLEAEAATQRELWRVAGAMAHVGGWSVSLPERRITWSDEVCAIHGQPAGHEPDIDEAISYFAPQARQTILELVSACARDGRAFDVELPFGSDAHGPRWVRSAGVPVRDDSGRIVRLEGLLQDITDSKRAALALADSRDRLAATLRAVPDLWFILDAEGRYQEVSAADHPGLARPWPEAVGRHLADVVPASLGRVVEDALAHARESGEIQTLSYELEAAGGARRHFEARIVPMDDGRFLYLTRDLTELRAAETAARQRAGALQALLAALPMLWFVIDADDRYEEVSRPDHPDLVRPWEQLRGQPLGICLDRDFARQCRDATARARTSGQPQRLDYNVEIDGQPRRFESRAVPLAEGRVLFITYDVTAFERRQEELQAQADAIRALLERTAAVLRAIPDLWFVVDEHDCYVEVSDPAHPSLRAPWERMSGRHVDEGLPADLAASMGEARRRARAGVQPQPLRYALATRDGETREFEARTIGMPGRRTLTLVRDITDTVRQDRRFREIAETVPVGIYEADREGACVWVNPSLRELAGLAPDDDPAPTFERAVHPDDVERVRANWARAVAAGRGSRQELRIVRPDGGVRWLASATRPTRDAGGRISGWIGALVDLTDRRQLEEERRAREVAEEARRRQSQFLSRMSHELRTPLNAILGFGQLLELEIPPGGTAAGQLGHVMQAGRRMLQLVDDLLQLQQLTQAATAPVAQPLAEAVVDALQLLQPLARQRRVLPSAVTGAAPDALADPQRLRQLIVQLGALIVRGCAPGQRVLFATGSDDAGHACLTVESAGTIASEDRLADVFAPVVAADHGEAYGEDALGLLIVREMARQLAGTVEVGPLSGGGSRVTVALPAAPARDVATG